MTNSNVVDTFLKQEEDTAAAAALLGIVERDGENGHVRVTPWVKGAGCACAAALAIPKTSIAKLERTEERHDCCGASHTVVQIEFVAEHAALLKHIATPGLDVRQALQLTRDEVLATTQRRQEPFTYGSLSGTPTAVVEACASR